MTILATGATGVDVVQGDLLDVHILREVFSGVSTPFLLNAPAADEPLPRPCRDLAAGIAG